MQDIYSKNYKKYMIIPVVLLLPILFAVFLYPGVQQGIDFLGGNEIIIRTTTNVSAVTVEEILANELKLTEMEVSAISSPGTNGIYIQYNKTQEVLDAEELIRKAQTAIEADNENDAMNYSLQVIKLLKKEDKTFDNAKIALTSAKEALFEYNEEFSKKIKDILVEKLGLEGGAEFQRREISATLGKASFESGIFIAIASAVALIIIIFIFFRQIVPVIGIVCAMIFDVLFGLMGMALFNVPLSLLSIATLLMLVGYSVDTNIMLTSRMLKEKDGTPGQRATNSLKTGLTMSATSLAALIAMLIVSFYYQIDIVFDIAIILTFGLFGDIIATWLFNVPILMWFVEKVKK